MKNQQTLPGITRISRIPVSGLSPHIQERVRAGMPCRVAGEQTDVPFTGIPLLTLTEEYDCGGTLSTAKITFQTSEPLPTAVPLAFLITTAERKTYLLGAREKPHPVVKQKATSGAPDGDPSLLTVEITLKAPLALTPID